MTIDPIKSASSKAADPSKSVHLSASAGSGKTRALKDRYLALLDALEDRVLDIDQAVAITFTDKAAAEIKERVMNVLPEPMLKKIIRGRQDLRISTIHSFCMNLLKRYPLEAGLPPDFGVLDSRDQASKIEQSIEQAIEELDLTPGMIEPLSGFTVEELIPIVRFLISIRSRLKRMEIDAGGPDGLAASIRAGLELDSLESEIITLITGADWCTSFRQMELLLRDQGDHYAACGGPGHLLLADAREREAAFRTALAIMKAYFTNEDAPRKRARIAIKDFKGGKRKDYEKLFFTVQELLFRFRSAYQRARAGREAISMLRLYLRAADLYQHAKLREGLLDFDDLEISAYRLLQNAESPDILYWLDRKVLHFLVDEFQDTSDIQWSILDRLTAEIFSGMGAEKRMQPTLFVVGDEKQSIYRFREANYRLMNSIKQKMDTLLLRGSREILTLDRNFRSTPEVIGSVNSVFAKLWGASYEPSAVERTGHTGRVRVIELAPASRGDGRSGPSEAEVLAREIRTFVGSGTVVYERSSDHGIRASSGEQAPKWVERPAAYGDCAVLIQSRTRLKEIEAALQQNGVPYRVVGGIGFYEEDEVQAIMNVLFHLWNRDDTLALAAALKSPLFGLTDRDIFDLRQDGGDMLPGLRRSRPDVWGLLHAWSMKAGLVPLAALVHTIIRDTGAYIRFGAHTAQAIFNLDKLLDTARDFDRRGYTTLQDFVEWVRNIRRTEQREASADMNLPGTSSSVSILTVHKAKGLEFPVVFLPNLNQASRSLTTGPDAIISETDGILRMALKTGDNPLYDDMWKGENGEQEELRREHQRLLYVAMTRARDHLVMIGMLANGSNPVKDSTWLDYLHRTVLLPVEKAAAPGPAVVSYAYPEWQAAAVNPGPISDSPLITEEDGAEEVDVRLVLENIQPLPRSSTPEWKRATDFLDAGQAAVLALETAGNDRVSPLTRGSVLHRCLEEQTKSGSYDLVRIINDYPEILSLEKEVLDQFVRQSTGVLTQVLNGDHAWIFDHTAAAYSELPFLLDKGTVLVSGIIDRVLVKEGKAYVVDYKSILIRGEADCSAWIGHYRPQIAIYCDAVRELFRIDRVEGYLLFLDSNRLERATGIG